MVDPQETHVEQPSQAIHHVRACSTAKKRGYTTLRKQGLMKTEAQMNKSYPEPVKVDLHANNDILAPF